MKKKKVKKEPNNTGQLLPVGNGGPGIDWTEVNLQMEKEPKK